MRFCRFELRNDISSGIIEKESVLPITPDPFSKWKKTGESYPLNKVKLLAPCVPTKVVAIGLNYTDHAAELSMEIPDEPIIFLKPAESVIGPGERIVYPAASQQVDYEAELGIVIKKTAKNISEDNTSGYILGYTCANDVTARDLQRKDGQWTRAKSFDTFAPIGPWIDTDFDPTDAIVEARLNGKVKQSSSTSHMIFSVPKLVSFISGVMTLNPGDVIMTGTPLGVGPMKPGDNIEIRIEHIGTLTNRVKPD